MLLGAAALLLATSYRQAAKLARAEELEPWCRALALALRAAAPVFAVSILYRNDIPDAAPMMYIAALCFGLIGWMRQRADGSAG